jgi:hypothetical protein
MKLIQLTHPEPNYEFWLDPDEIVVMERYTKPVSTLITMDGDKPNVTAIVMKNGRIMSCKETPAQIMEIVKGNA